MTPTPRALPLPLPLPSRGASIASSSAPDARGGGGGGGYRVGYRAPRAPRRLERRAISEPSSSKSSSEVFVEEEMSRRAQNAADAATETPEEAVAALEEDVARLDARRLALTTDLDAAYDACFGGVTVEFEIVVDEIAAADADDAEAEKKPPKPSTSKTTTTRTFDAMDEETFRAIGADEPAVVTALIDVAKSDAERWLTFQRDAHRHKLQRDRVVAELAAARAELRVARRGGGAAAAAKAAMDAARLAAAEAKGASEGGILSDAAAARRTKRVVLISGFESFNVGLYKTAAKKVAKRCPGVELVVFSDRDIESKREDVAAALEGADVFFGSLLFDFDQVEWLRRAIEKIPTRFVFESALELMSETSVGSFEMKPAPDGQKAGPPPAVKAILSKFGSGKEEDKLVGYLSFLKIGPALLRFVPGRKAKDLRNWLTVYGYWNQGGVENVEEAFVYVAKQYLADVLSESGEDAGPEDESRGGGGGGFLEGLLGRGPRAKPPKETPPFGCYHPDLERADAPWPTSVTEYLEWYDKTPARAALPPDAPSVAILLYRKHVITKQPYLAGLVEAMQEKGVRPIPMFINGVEAHTIVRDLLTSDSEQAARAAGVLAIDSLRPDATRVDAVVSTVGFPLVGGPAGSMEAGRQAEVAQSILRAKNVPYIVAAPLLIQDIASWERSGVGGLQSVILYALPELDGAVDTVPLGGLVGDDIFLAKERTYALADRLKRWVSLRKKPPSRRKVAVMLYGFPPGVGATGTAALLNVPKARSIHWSPYDRGRVVNADP
jgi:magnesium chelatase subunit H